MGVFGAIPKANMGKCRKCGETAADIKARGRTPQGEPYEVVQCRKCRKMRRTYTV